MDRVIVDKLQIIKLRRLDTQDREANYYRPKHEARRAIEDYNEQKRLEREFSYEY